LPASFSFFSLAHFRFINKSLEVTDSLKLLLIDLFFEHLVEVFINQRFFQMVSTLAIHLFYLITVLVPLDHELLDLVI